MNKKQKLIIFDVDGVIEVEEKINIVRSNAYKKKISEIHNTDIKGADELIKDAEKKLPKNKCTTTAYKLEYLGIPRKKYFKILNSIKPDGLIECHKNCIKTLENLNKDFLIITYSNTPKKATISTLKYLKVWKYIKACYCADDFNESKPSVNNLKIILNKYGYNSSDTFIIGNAPSKDIVPAKDIGATAILFDAFHKFSRDKNADYIVNDLWDIVGIVREI